MARIDTDMRFWITVENRSLSPLVNLHLDRLEIPGFEKTRWCWGPHLDKLSCGSALRPGPLCIAPGPAISAPPDEFALCAYLRPREVLTVWGDLKANADLPPHELIALVSWQELPEPSPPCKLKDKTKCPPASATPMEASNASPIITLGRAEPVSSWRYLFRRYTPRAEISIPGALTLLGLFFAWWSGRKEQKNQIWTTMLGKVHEFTMHFYMPMASMLAAAVSATDAFLLTAEEQLKKRYGHCSGRACVGTARLLLPDDVPLVAAGDVSKGRRLPLEVARRRKASLGSCARTRGRLSWRVRDQMASVGPRQRAPVPDSWKRWTVGLNRTSHSLGRTFMSGRARQIAPSSLRFLMRLSP
jgi:hypothetical protein